MKDRKKHTLRVKEERNERTRTTCRNSGNKIKA